MKYAFTRTLILLLALTSWCSIHAQTDVTLVSTGSVWRYLDDGSSPDPSWRLISFFDEAWGLGTAEFGYGDGDEVTTVQSNRLDGTRIITTYFRHYFEVPNTSIYSNIQVRLKRDDGAIVYLNDVEIFRANMPLGPVDSLTLASAAAPDDGTNFHNMLVTTPLLGFANLLAVELHQNSTNSSDISFDLAVHANIIPVPPTVTITSPTNNARFFTPVNATINVTATDADSQIAIVEFFSGNTKIGEDTTFPYSLTVTNAPAGNYALTARTTDANGLSATSSVVNVTIISSGDVLSSTGATWSYLDDGSDLNSQDWQGALYDPFFWPTGPAEFGYGDDDEATLLQSNRLDGTFIWTFYFRRNFNLSNPAQYTNLLVRLLRDDGGIVYLNDVEVFRSNMPTGAIDYVTPSSTSVATADEDTFHQYPVDASLLINGDNILAVEVHQSGTNSTDVSFDLLLLGNVPEGPPTVALTAPANGVSLPPGNVTLNATASDADGFVTRVEFFANTVKIGEDLTTPYSMVWTNPAAGTYALTARATDDDGRVSTSAVVNITILAGITARFQFGTGYTNTIDTDVRAGAPDMAFGANTTVSSDSDVNTTGSPVDPDPAHGLLQFGNIFGSGTNQVPPGSTIVLATLALRTANTSADTVSVHRVLIPWTEESTWNGLTDGISADDTEAVSTPDHQFLSGAAANVVTLDVTAAVQAWANGAPNHGWVFLPTGDDGYQFNSSEATTASQRPMLTITYPEPPRPQLQIRRLSGTQLQVSWTNGAGFTLQRAASVVGPWGQAANQANPQNVTPGSVPSFYRLVR